jgi:predicted nucleic acid-binding protein
MPQEIPKDCFLDTNLVVRLVTGDPPEMAQPVKRLFERAALKEGTLRLTSLVVGESLYVLTSFYKLPRDRVAQALIRVIDLPGVRTAEADPLKRSLDLFAENPKLHFVDAYLIARAETDKRGVATADEAIQKSSLVPVHNPMQGSAKPEDG